MKAFFYPVVCVVVLTACGGGGASSPTPPAGASSSNASNVLPVSLPKRYSVVDLGPNVQTTRLNLSGAVVGAVQQGAHQIAFVYQNGAMTHLAGLPGDTDSQANDISDTGEIVGQSWFTQSAFPNQVLHAVKFAPGSPVYLGTAAIDTQNSFANAVNDVGLIAGGSGPINGPCFSVVTLFDGKGGATGVSGTSGDAVAVNLHGTVAFTSFTTGTGGCSGFYFPMTYPPLANVPLPPDSAGGHVTDPAADINDTGDVVGSYDVSSSGGSPAIGIAGFFAHGGTVQEIDAPGGASGTTLQPMAINNNRLIVGRYQGQDTTAPFRAFIWLNGTLADLNTLLPPNCGVTLQNATDINDLGQIAAIGTLGGVEHGFLLTPQ